MQPDPASQSGPSIPVSAVTGAGEAAQGSLSKGPHETWLDHVVLLLHVAAGIEHELMVQYLYAAYSLGGDQVPVDQREMVQTWRRNLLAIAKEEMGHFLTAQNVLTVLGAPINWERGNYAWSNQYFPLRKLELSPFAMDSLSCYVYSEAPAKTAAVTERYYGIPVEEVNRIIEQVQGAVGEKPRRVEELYAKIVDIIKNPTLIPDSAFHSETYAIQASWEEWGKGYKPYAVDPESNPAAGALGPIMEPLRRVPFPIAPMAAQARVIVSPVASRTQVLAALQLIGEQGEATQFKPEDDQPSHFDRFINIYVKFEKITWTPTRMVPNNPTTWIDKPNGTYIESEHSRDWAQLFNLRYRMLLTYLAHTYQLPTEAQATHRRMRAGALHRVFSEMYNLRAIANMLVRLPLRDEKRFPDPRRAGPPFELPFTLALPASDDDRWRLHRELLLDAQLLSKKLLPDAPIDGKQYLAAQLDLDGQSRMWIDTVLQDGHVRRSVR
jgi:Ferritin-like